MKRRRLRQANSVAAKGGLSAKSMIKAKSIAASILNMSEYDLADIMETDQVSPGDRDSTLYTNSKLRNDITFMIDYAQGAQHTCDRFFYTVKF